MGFLMIIICWIGASFLSNYSDFSLFESFVVVALGVIFINLNLMIKNNN